MKQGTNPDSAGKMNSRKKQLAELGQALDNVMHYYAGMPDLAEPTSDLDAFFGLDPSIKQLKNRRFYELLETEKTFLLSLSFQAKSKTDLTGLDATPREKLIRALQIKGHQFNPCIRVFLALREVEEAALSNLNMLKAAYKHPIGTLDFNNIFMKWLEHLPTFISTIAPAAALIEIYQAIDPCLRREVAETFCMIDSGSKNQVDSYLIGVAQRVAKYQLLLNDILKELLNASKRDSFHLVFADFEAFKESFARNLGRVEETTYQANLWLEEHRREKGLDSPKQERVFLTSIGKLKIYASEEESQDDNDKVLRKDSKRVL